MAKLSKEEMQFAKAAYMAGYIDARTEEIVNVQEIENAWETSEAKRIYETD